VSGDWQLLGDRDLVGDLDTLDFAEVCGAAEPGPARETRKSAPNGRRGRSA
jgi:hypothetical protein